MIRQIGFPNVSYGEDYAVALRITREYKIGRIYENLYLCRRWKNNTDAGLSVEKQNLNDFYKDKLRTAEIKARFLTNKKELSLDSQRRFAEFSGGKIYRCPCFPGVFLRHKRKAGRNWQRPAGIWYRRV